MKKFYLKLQGEKDLEKRFFRYATFYTSIIAAIALIINYLSNLGLVLQGMCFVYAIISSLCFYYSAFDDKYNASKIAFFVGMIILLDVAYFFNGGLDSSITYIFIITHLLLSLVIKRSKIKQFLIFVLFIANLLILFYLQISYPNWITPYPDINSKYTDLIGGFGIVSFLISVIINFFKSTYERFLNDIDSKNKDLIISEREAQIERQKAEKANDAKKDFLSVMSHEIRTPLNAIISIINLFETDNGKNKEEYIRTLKYSSENLLALVSNILDFTKIDAGEVKLEEINFDLKNIVESIVSLYRPQSMEKNNHLNLSFEGFEDYNFKGDSLRINQILINLLSNAIKFTENGTISLNIKYLGKNNETDKSKIYFEVKDTGIGVSEEKREEIFEKFTQENTSITRKYGGSGLGLSITKKLIELMDSKIFLDSKVDSGSTFYFELELKKAEKQNNILNIKSEEQLDIKILLVEDNKVNIAVTTKFLQKWNIKYEVAENGVIAVEKFSNGKFDLILMDLQMPEMDGFTATQEIRKKDMNIPIIALTANSMTEEREKCLSSGFNEYLTKPFKPDQLKQALIYFSEKK